MLTARPTAPILLAVVLGLAPALAGCGGSDDSSSSSSNGSGSATSGGSSGACKGYTAGKGGVLRLFCDGQATATVTLEGKKTTLKGGDCAIENNLFAVNAGVAVGPEWPDSKAKPDYVGLIVPYGSSDNDSSDSSSGAGSAMSMSLGGTTTVVGKADLKVASDKKSVTGSGTSLDGKQVTVDVSCPSVVQ